MCRLIVPCADFPQNRLVEAKSDPGQARARPAAQPLAPPHSQSWRYFTSFLGKTCRPFRSRSCFVFSSSLSLLTPAHQHGSIRLRLSNELCVRQFVHVAPEQCHPITIILGVPRTFNFRRAHSLSTTSQQHVLGPILPVVEKGVEHAALLCCSGSTLLKLSNDGSGDLSVIGTRTPRRGT